MTGTFALDPAWLVIFLLGSCCFVWAVIMSVAARLERESLSNFYTPMWVGALAMFFGILGMAA